MVPVLVAQVVVAVAGVLDRRVRVVEGFDTLGPDTHVAGPASVHRVVAGLGGAAHRHHCRGRGRERGHGAHHLAHVPPSGWPASSQAELRVDGSRCGDPSIRSRVAARVTLQVLACRADAGSLVRGRNHSGGTSAVSEPIGQPGEYPGRPAASLRCIVIRNRGHHMAGARPARVTLPSASVTLLQERPSWTCGLQIS